MRIGEYGRSQAEKGTTQKKRKTMEQDNPDWIDNESMKVIASKVRETTFISYKTVLPLFCHWKDKTPDQIIAERDKQWINSDRKIRYYYEDRMNEFKQFLIQNDYGSRTIKNYLGRVSGLFSNNRLDLNLDNQFWRKADKTTSELVQAQETTKRYPDNDEIRLIIELATNQQTLAILLGYPCGLVPADVVSLTWDRLNIDFEKEKREFIHVENVREKTGALHVFVLNPDLLHYLRAQWIDAGKPVTGWIFKGYKGNSMVPRNLNQFFKELAVKTLGEKRGTELVFKDLRDSYNEAILDCDVNEEIKDTLMGHLRESAKANYSISFGTMIKTYREKIFPKLAINGWRLKQDASKVDNLVSRVDELRNALGQVERENIAYKTRVDNLQEQMGMALKEITALHGRNESLGSAVDKLWEVAYGPRVYEEEDLS
ncbi:MAG: site-specific integrase [Candidatus Bathyarchaeota archaeon]|nr:site-specific integrase [Candidatus Bathyarchaeota archaeon]